MKAICATNRWQPLDLAKVCDTDSLRLTSDTFHSVVCLKRLSCVKRAFVKIRFN